MIDKQEVLLQLACAALQGGMSVEEVYEGMDGGDNGDYTLFDIANAIYPEAFPYPEDEPVSTTKNTY